MHFLVTKLDLLLNAFAGMLAKNSIAKNRLHERPAAFTAIFFDGRTTLKDSCANRCMTDSKKF